MEIIIYGIMLALIFVSIATAFVCSFIVANKSKTLCSFVKEFITDESGDELDIQKAISILSNKSLDFSSINNFIHTT